MTTMNHTGGFNDLLNIIPRIVRQHLIVQGLLPLQWLRVPNQATLESLTDIHVKVGLNGSQYHLYHPAFVDKSAPWYSEDDPLLHDLLLQWCEEAASILQFQDASHGKKRLFLQSHGLTYQDAAYARNTGKASLRAAFLTLSDEAKLFFWEGVPLHDKVRELDRWEASNA